jgi:curved DNA-binding protein CbpA
MEVQAGSGRSINRLSVNECWGRKVTDGELWEGKWLIMPVTGARWRGRGCCLTAAHLLLWAALVLEVVAQQKSDHYKLLGVKREATDREIKKAYKLAIKHHPDKSPECRMSQESSQCKRANRVFIQIAEAYETLSDPEKRRCYDQTDFVDASDTQQHENQQRWGSGKGGLDKDVFFTQFEAIVQMELSSDFIDEMNAESASFLMLVMRKIFHFLCQVTQYESTCRESSN